MINVGFPLFRAVSSAFKPQKLSGNDVEFFIFCHLEHHSSLKFLSSMIWKKKRLWNNSGFMLEILKDANLFDDFNVRIVINLY